jgi:P-type Cu+ transporter
MSTPVEIQLPVTGMTCSACTRNVERALRKVDGVLEVSVNPATDRATVRMDPAAGATIASLTGQIEGAGYGVATARIELPVTGMTCTACERNVRRAIERSPGVLDASVNLATERAQVRYIPGATNRKALIAAIEAAGYGVIDIADATAPADAEQAARAAEIARQRRLVIFGALFTIPLVVLGMTRHFMHSVPFLMDAFPWLMHDAWLFVFAALATPVQVVLGRQYLVGAYKSLRNGTANMDVLVAMGSTAAYVYGLIVLAGLVFGFSDVVGTDDYFESAAVILTLITLGKLLEARAKGHTSDAIRKLMALAPRTATILRDGDEVVVDIDALAPGDLVLIRPGERVAVDAIVVEGQSAVDESMLTGESMPVSKSAGSELIAGTINRQGRLVAESTRVGAETTLAQIIRLVQDAQGSKAPIQRIADQVSAVFVPVVLLLAAITLFGWLVIGGAGLPTAILNTIAVLVIACPCALGLATPTAIMVGMGRGAQMGILFRNSEALENAHRLNTIAFDKTGTITRGEPQVVGVAAAPGYDEETVLGWAASAERASEHPLGEAIVRAARARGLAFGQPDTFEARTGLGIEAVVAGRRIVVGSPRFLQEQGIAIAALADTLGEWQGQARTVIAVASDGALAGVVALADTVKSGSAAAVTALRSMGLGVVMITGDHEDTARVIAHEVNIERYHAGVLPGEKTAIVRQMQAGAQVVGMVGDGINDAPALASADVGIAIGTGTDIAMEASDVTLVGGELISVARAISLSRATMRTIYENLFWAFIYNLVLIPVAMLGLLIPMFAAGAMAFSSVFVVSNSLRLRRSSLPLLQDGAPDTARSSRAGSSAPSA